MNIKTQLNKYKIKPDLSKDQFFLADEEVIKKIVDLAEVGRDDVVLEIGAGVGNLTKELAKKAGKVITFEIDKRFQSLLDTLPNRVEIHWEDAWPHIQMRGKYPHKHRLGYNKVVANPPYSLIEPFLHNLTFINYDKAILVVPLGMVNKIRSNPVFSSFFKVVLKAKVSKDKFYPVPKVNSAIVQIIKLPDSIETKDLGLFLKQYLYQHEEWKVKNSLREGLIKYAKLAQGKKLTKNQARKMIVESGINETLLEKTSHDSEIYGKVSGFSLKI